jgi:hypothetical protein
MDDQRQAEVFARRKELAELVGVPVPNVAQPLSLGSAILIATDISNYHNEVSVRFGENETLSLADCEALKSRFNDELLLDDAAD